MNNCLVPIIQIAAKMGKYTSYRSEVISYIFIAICAIAFLYLVIHQINSHK